jgi:AcrR family transcriptional regulator
MSTGRRERKKQELRERIVDAAETLITRHGLPQLTVDQIAELTDISQATFFNYFPSKADVIDALVERLIARFNEVVDLAHGADSSLVNKIDALFRATAELPEDQHRLVRDVIAETVRSTRGDPVQALSRMRRLFTADVAAGQERGEVRRDETAETLADTVLGVYVSVMLFWSTDADYPVADRLLASAALVTDLLRP